MNKNIKIKFNKLEKIINSVNKRYDEMFYKLKNAQFVLENEIKTAMSNSFGFGGCNISLIIKVF